MAFFEDCPLLCLSASSAATSSAHISAGSCARMKRATVGSMPLSLDDFLLPLGGTEASAVTCSSRNLCTPTVGAIAVKRQVVLGQHDCINRVDVVRALTSSGVQPVLVGLQARIRHHPIVNLVNKIIEWSR